MKIKTFILGLFGRIPIRAKARIGTGLSGVANRRISTSFHVRRLSSNRPSIPYANLFALTLFLALIFAIPAKMSAQVTTGEYFWDTDPGEGAGYFIEAQDGAFDESVEAIIRNGIDMPSDTGAHIFNIRIRDNCNEWGPVFRKAVYVHDTAFIDMDVRVTRAEYFWDTDPGEGLGTMLLAFDGAYDEALEAVFTSTAILPAAGEHLFNIRVQDDQSIWGPVYKKPVRITGNLDAPTPFQVTNAEYFWDTDPGEGSGTALLAFDGAFDEALEAVFTSSASLPSTGIHLFHIRVSDEKSDWGPVYKKPVNITGNLDADPLFELSAGEYFWDTDPGEGSGTVILAFDGAYDEALESVFESTATLPATGLHLFHIRVRDGADTWGPVYKKPVRVTDNLDSAKPFNVSAGEYFWDSDPGEGSGTTLLAFDGAYDEALESIFDGSATLPSIGLHLLHIRVRDETSTWGPVFKKPVIITENLDAGKPFEITAGEYFWDTDPGEGSAYPLMVFDGAFDEALECVFDTNGTLPDKGLHLFCIRGTDENNQWGPVYKRPIYNMIPWDSLEVAILEPDTILCEGDSIELHATGAGSFVWSPSTGLNKSAGPTVIAAPSITTTYTIIGEGDPGVYDTTSITLTVTPKPAIELGSDTTICESGTLVLEPGDGYDSYLWNDGSSLDSLLVDSSGTYAVTVTNVSGCAAEDSVVITTDTAINPGVLTPGGLAFCEGDSLNISISSGFASYAWNTGETTNSIHTDTAGTFYAFVTAISGCTGYSDTVTVTRDTSPEPMITAPASDIFCDGDSLTLNADPGYVTYAWSNGSGASMTTIYDTDTLSVTVTDANGCEGTSPLQIVTKVPNPDPVITPDGPTTFCEGDTVVLDAGAGYVSYSWTGGGIASTLPVTTGGSYLVSVTDTNGCSGTAAAEIVTVNANPTPVITPDGPLAFCDGDSVILSVDPGYTGISWSSGASDPDITVFTDGVFDVTVIDTNGCTGTSTKDTVKAHPNPTPSITPSGPVEACEGDTLNLDAGSGFITYSWTPGGSTQIISPAATGSYSVTVTDGNGCSGAATPVNVTIHALPAPTLTAIGDTIFCEGDSVELVTDTGFAGYSWSDGSSGITSRFVSTSGVYVVTVTDTNSCEGVTGSIEVISNPNPVAAITPPGPELTLCEGATGVLSATPGMTGYLWSTGSLTDTIHVVAAGDYAVTVTDSNGCSDTSDTVSVNYHIPIEPFITQSGDTLFANPTPGSEYQWFQDATLLPGDTLQFLVPDSSGTFQVRYRDSIGCIALSDTFSIIITSQGGISFGGWQGTILPNPHKDKFLFDLSIPDGGQVRVGLWDLNGKLIREDEPLITNGKAQIEYSTRNLALGVYYLRVTYKGEQKVYKVIKTGGQ